jgi:DNA-binding CsgD family transcriptional regulator
MPLLLEERNSSIGDSLKDHVVVGPAPPLTSVEANTLQLLKQKVRQPGGGIRATPRERQAIGLLALGMTDKETAVKMQISPRTVQAHLRHFCQRNGVRNRPEATALWTGSHCEYVVRHLTDVIADLNESPINPNGDWIN